MFAQRFKDRTRSGHRWVGQQQQQIKLSMVSKLRDLYQKRKGKASPELLDILKDESKKSPEKKSAKPPPLPPNHSCLIHTLVYIVYI